MKVFLELQMEGNLISTAKVLAKSDWHLFLIDLVTVAMKDDVSDLHIEVRKDEGITVIRRRELGELFEYTTLSVEDGVAFIRYIYCNLAKNTDPDFISKKPQDGSFTQVIQGKEVFIRLVTLPDMQGNDLVLRLIEQKNNDPIPLVKLGYAESQSQQLHKAVAYADGMIVICGQTGSGKSTSMSNLLGLDIKEKKGTKKVITIENPPEVRIGKNVTQIPVPGTNTGDPMWAMAIKACMRADPDILLIGETRDPDSAELVIEAALTGHLALTTLHVSNAVATVERFEQLGISLGMLASPSLLRVLVYQTLLQVLCEHCKLEFLTVIGSDDGRQYGNIMTDLQKCLKMYSINSESLYVRNPKGCSKCKQRGIISRSVAAEVVALDETMFSFIKKGEHLALRQYFLDNFRDETVEYHAFMKVANGQVDILDALKKVRSIFDVLLRGESA